DDSAAVVAARARALRAVLPAVRPVTDAEIDAHVARHRALGAVRAALLAGPELRRFARARHDVAVLTAWAVDGRASVHARSDEREAHAARRGVVRQLSAEVVRGALRRFHL